MKSTSAVPTICFLTPVWNEIVGFVRQQLPLEPSLPYSTSRKFGLTRKWAIPILEECDRIRLTARQEMFALREIDSMRKTLLYGGPVLTQVNGLVANSIAVDRNQDHRGWLGSATRSGIQIVRQVQSQGEIRHSRISRCSHTHILLGLTLGCVNLHGCTSIDQCLKKIADFARTLPASEWVVGTGYQPDDFKRRVEPDRFMLDRVTGGRPAFIFSKDEHTAW